MTRRLRPRVVPVLAAVLVAVLAGCGETPPAGSPPAPPAPSATVWFEEVAAEAGLDFVGFNGGTGRLYTAEVNCGGGALVDVDGDGDLDVYLAQGALLEPGATLADAELPPRPPDRPLTDRLYRNDTRPGGALRFTDVTASAGLEGTVHFGCGVATGDFDRDGRVDLYLANFHGPDQLLRNRGDGTFDDVTAAAGIRNLEAAAAASFFDYDADGWLDLVVVNNMRFDYADPVVCRDLAGRRDYCGPGTYPFVADVLLRNRGDGTFEDVSRAAGLAGAAAPGLGVVTADFDGDGRDDIYVANDGQANQLWRNRGDGTFEESALLSGLALNAAGQAEASMGIASGDPDRDGDLDLLLTHFPRETNTFYRNQGGGLFVDASVESGLGPPSGPYTGFGTAFADFDLDGDEDLVVANGAVNRIAAQVEAGEAYPLREPNQVFENVARGPGELAFREITREAGPAFALSEVSRGVLDGDLDGDGDRDLVIVNNNGPVRLLRNRGTPEPERWIGARVLLSRAPPLDAIGAEVALLVDGEPRQWRWVRTDGSYGSARDPRVHFGLPAGTATGSPNGSLALRVRFPDGDEATWPDLEPGRYHVLVAGEAPARQAAR